ncbi:MAG TPA: transposase, partial [Candidatus Tyrphobacter sp.]
MDTFGLAEKGPSNGKKHPRSYPLDFRQNIIDLARAGKKLEELAAQFDIAPQTVRNWVKQADLDGGRRSDGLTTAERDELAKLRKENRQLKVEREILSKAAAWFARETDSIPPRSSN